jgi:C4-dicarboxylate-specific signal transduction histidine kinase
LRIEASTKPRAQVELRIVDRGGGIPASVMPRLFEPFFTTKSPGEGTGLGLSISHGMMQSIGGGLSVTNTGTGACFILTMQAALASARDVGGVSAAGNPLTLMQTDS